MTNAKLYDAMAKAFHEIEGASKDSLNPHFKSKYADLSSVVAAVKPALAKHGLWFRQMTHMVDGGVSIETFICHATGEEVSCGVLFTPASKNDAQAYGSALSYCRRYSLMTAFGVCPEDDDGNAASRPTPEKKAEPLISDEQRMDLQGLIEGTGSNIIAFCQFYKIASLPELPASKFDHAKKSLMNKLGKKEDAA